MSTNGIYLEQVSKGGYTDKAVTLVEAKNFAKTQNMQDDQIFEILIEAAQRAFEEYTHSLLFDSSVTAIYSVEEDGQLQLPYMPINSITSVTSGGNDYSYDIVGQWMEVGATDELTVEYQCGLYDTPADVDAKVKLGLLKWIATNYNDRENTIIDQIEEMPNSSEVLWEPYRFMIP